MLAATSSLIAASGLFAVAFGAPLPKPSRSLVARAAYQVFSGDGTTAQGWPDQVQWSSFESLWATNLPTISISCGQFGVPENSEAEKAAIKNGLIAASKKSGVDASYLLAIMMQESKGCVRAPTTNYGVRNPGLFQDFNGAASCNDGAVINPCPDATIAQMIAEGAGIGMQVGLSIGIAQTGASDVSKYYKAARIYNSGSIVGTGNLGQGIATHCYASDIANRLLGWVEGGSTCNENTIGSLTGSTPYVGNGNNTPPTTTTPKPSSTPSATPTAAPTPNYNNNNNDHDATTPGEGETPVTTTPVVTAEKFSGAAANCKKYHEVKAGETCESTGIDLATLVSLNAGLNISCNNLWLGYAYCIAI